MSVGAWHFRMRSSAVVGVVGGEVTDDLLERLGCLGHGERERELDRRGWRRRRWFRRLRLLRLRLGTAVRLRVRRPRLRVGIVRELRVGIVRELLLFTSLRWGPILFTLGFFLFVIILVLVLVILVVIVALTAHGAFQELLSVHPALLQLLAHSLHLEVLILIPGIRIVTFVVVVGVVGFILPHHHHPRRRRRNPPRRRHPPGCPASAGASCPRRARRPSC